jgi:hypothetical protein
MQAQDDDELGDGYEIGSADPVIYADPVRVNAATYLADCWIIC